MADAKATDVNSATADAFGEKKAYILHLIMERAQWAHDVNHSHLLLLLARIRTHNRFTNLQRRHHLRLPFLHGNERLWGTVTNEITAFDFEGVAEAGDIAGSGATEPDIVWAV